MRLERLPQRLAHYQIEQWLGTGGMGSVYRATVLHSAGELREGSTVAVKLLDPELRDDPEQVRAFEREAGVGLGVRHPHLCAIYDLGSGVIAGEPVRYLVRAYQPGQNLRELVGLPSTDGFLRRVALGMADALSELHGRGLLHRDLKPENVFVDEEGQAIVTDFGLSAFVSGPRGGTAKRFDGTLSYAAPEWFVPGAEIGAEADLYALGLILYELATGKHPRPTEWLFSGAAIDARFPAPSTLNRSLSYFMDQVILQLLDPDPERRLRPAELLTRVVRDGESSAWWRKWTRASDEQVRSGKRAFFVDRRTRLVGRETELAVLRERVRAALPARRGVAVLLLGEAGLGKTRLLDEVLESLDSEGFSALILISRGVSVSVSLPFYPLGEMIETAFGLKGLSAAQMAPLLKDQLKDVLEMPDALALEAASFLMGSESESFADQRAAKLYTHLLTAIAQRTPTILVLEGLQWVDPGTIAVLRSLLPVVATLPLVLVITARESELERDALSFAKEIEAGDARSTLRLPPLGAEAMAMVLADLAMPPQHHAALTAAAAGNPLFLLQAEQLLAREAAAGGPSMALPLDLLELYRRVAMQLTPAERRYVEAAAVLGTRFRPEAVQAVLRLRPLEADEILRRLLHVHRLFVPEERALRFERPGLHMVILEALEPHARELLHREMAAYYQRLAPSLNDRPAVKVAEHALRGRAFHLLVPALPAAVHWYLSRQQRDQARQLILGALELLEQEPRGSEHDHYNGTLRLLLAQVLGASGAFAQQEEELKLGLKSGMACGDDHIVGVAYLRLGEAAVRGGRALSAGRFLAQAETRLRLAGDRRLLVQALTQKASANIVLGDQDEARRVLRMALSEASRARDRLGYARVLLEVGRGLTDVDDLLRARRLLAHAVRLAETEQAQLEIGRACVYAARAYRELAEFVAAEQLTDRAIAIAKALRDPGLEARAMFLKGDVQLRRKQYPLAHATLDRAKALAELSGDRAMLVYSLADLAVLLQARRYQHRDLERSIAFAKQAVRHASALELPREQLLAQNALALAYLAAGRPRWAITISEKALRIARGLSMTNKRLAEMLFVHYRILKALKHPDAMPRLQETARIVRARINRQRSDQARSLMANRDPFNREVLKELRRQIGTG